jgi:hypothetical protein
VALAEQEIDSDPSSIVATLAVESSVDPGLHIWVVAFEGVCIPAHEAPTGTAPPCNTEMNVVLDAETGDFLMGFSYR